MTSISIDTDVPIKTQIYLFSYVRGKRADIGLELNITVCGKEKLLAQNGNPLVRNIIQTRIDKNETIYDWELKELFIFYKTGESMDACNNETISLYNDTKLTVPYEPPKGFLTIEMVSN